MAQILLLICIKKYVASFYRRISIQRRILQSVRDKLSDSVSRYWPLCGTKSVIIRNNGINSPTELTLHAIPRCIEPKPGAFLTCNFKDATTFGTRFRTGSWEQKHRVCPLKMVKSLGSSSDHRKKGDGSHTTELITLITPEDTIPTISSDHRITLICTKRTIMN